MRVYIYTHILFTYTTLPWTDGCSIDECPDSHVTTLRPQAVDGTFTEAVQQWKVPFGNGGFNGKIIANHPLIVMVPWFSLVRQSFNQETRAVFFRIISVLLGDVPACSSHIWLLAASTSRGVDLIISAMVQKWDYTTSGHFTIIESPCIGHYNHQKSLLKLIVIWPTVGHGNYASVSSQLGSFWFLLVCPMPAAKIHSFRYMGLFKNGFPQNLCMVESQNGSDLNPGSFWILSSGRFWMGIPSLRCWLGISAYQIYQPPQCHTLDNQFRLILNIRPETAV